MGLTAECTDMNVFITFDKMKQFLTGLISLFTALGAQAQTLETGVAINATHLWETSNKYSHKIRTEGLGMSIMARYQNPHTIFLFKNNEVGMEYSRGGIWMWEHVGPSQIGGDHTRIEYSSASFTLNNYFANFGTLNNRIQFSLGMHYNFKVISRSDGIAGVCTYYWDSLAPQWMGLQTNYTYYSLDGKNNQYLERFNMGPTVGIALPSFTVGHLKLRCRYDMNISLGGELKKGMDFNYMRQRVTLSVVWGKQH